MRKYFKKEKILDIAHHRNGVGGAPFSVAIVDDGESEKLVVLFEEPGYCAVFDLEKLSQRDIKFGSNSWRGDAYEEIFREKMKKALDEQLENRLRDILPRAAGQEKKS